VSPADPPPSAVPVHQPLARKWRPRSFAALIGQEPVVRALQNALRKNQLHPVLLFSGTRGVGKTTLGRLVAKALNCEQGVGPDPCGNCAHCREIDDGSFPDFLEIDAASRTRVEETRELLANVPYLPTRGRFRVYLIDEVHMLSAHSFNALLKTLEEPPPHVYFLLATTEPEKVPPTIQSRALRFALRHVPAERIAGHLAEVSAAEGFETDPMALGLLAGAAEGSVRDALSLMDLAVSYGGGQIRESDVVEILGTLGHEQLDALLRAVLERDPARLGSLLESLHALEPDYAGILESMARRFVELAARLEWGSPLPVRAEEVARWEDLLKRVDPLDLQLDYEIVRRGLEEIRQVENPRVTFDMTCIRLLSFRPAVPERGLAAGSAPAGDRLPAPDAPPISTASVPSVAAPPLAPENWPVYVSRLALGGAARQILNHSVCRQFADRRLVLGLAEGVGVLLTEQLKGRIEAALREAEGDRVEVVFETGGVEGPTPAHHLEQVREGKLQQARLTLEQDPDVQKLLALGFEIQPNSIVSREPDPEGDHE
jgi:DNA polymerase-3 subunit gamma/tau